MACKYQRIVYLNDWPPKCLPEDHKKFLSFPFIWECTQDDFEDGEIGWLSRYGSWCRSLMIGKIEPSSKSQRRFIVVANEFQRPEKLYPHERLWMKYLDSCRSSSNPPNSVERQKFIKACSEELTGFIREGVDIFDDLDFTHYGYTY